MTKKPFARRAFLCGVNSLKTAIAYSLCYVLIFFVLSCHFFGVRTVFVLARLFSSAPFFEWFPVSTTFVYCQK